MMKKHLFIPSKIDYVRGKRPEVNCILCAILNNDQRVFDSTIFKTSLMTIALNIYPYNPGHLMIFPNRHLECLQDLTDEEVLEMHKLSVLSIKVLQSAYNAQSFNVGYNLGENSGASIKHLHLHIVPRYKNELGFVDIISGSKIFVEDPRKSLEELKKYFQKEFQKENIN